MLRLLAPRAAAQSRLIGAVLALVTVGVTLLGLAALLLGTSATRAFDSAVRRATAEQIDSTAYAAGLPAASVPGVVADTRAVLADALRPLPVTTSALSTAAVRRVQGVTGVRVGYLGAVDHLEARGRLLSGRLPRAGAARPEAVVPQGTATALGLRPGSTVTLGAQVASTAGQRPVTVQVVGVFAPRLDGGGWERDPLGGAGVVPRYHASVRLASVPAYGPFVLDPADLAGTGSTVDRLTVVAHPDLSRPSRPVLEGVVDRLASANPQLTARLHGRVSVERVESALPGTLAGIRTQEVATRAAVLVVVLLGGALTAAALTLAGRLVAALRDDESALLASMGADRRQFVRTAAAEAAAIAAVSSVLAVPLSALAYRAATAVPAVRAAGLAGGPSVTAGSVLAVLAGSVLLAGLLVLPALRPEHGVTAGRGRAGLVVRSGADVLTVGLAAVGWWQLRSAPDAAGGVDAVRVDAVRVVAPVLCLVAGALVALRLMPPLLAAADRSARRSAGLVLPLAAFEAARRPRAVAAALLVVLGAAAGAFGVAFGSSWDRSQHEQADLRAGTDLRVALSDPPRAGDGDRIRTAGGGTVSPAVRRNVLVGRWIGDPGAPPQVVAVDAGHAGALLRGRPPQGRGWADVARPLAAPAPVDGIPVSPTTDVPGTAAGGPAAGSPAAGASTVGGPTIGGTATGDVPLLASAQVVLQDSTGLRVVRDAATVPLDGRTRPLALLDPLPDGVRLVAAGLQVVADPRAPLPAPDEVVGATVTVDLRLPAPGGTAAGGPWSAAAAGPQAEAVKQPVARWSRDRGTATVRLGASLDLNRLFDEPGQLVATAFPPPGPVPVVVSQRLAGSTGLRAGGTLQLTVGTTDLLTRVVDVVPDVPSVPGGAAVLVDADLLSRALLAAGDLAPVVNSWWIGGVPDADAPRAAAAVTALGRGTVTARAAVAVQLAAGPLRVALPVALAALVAVALLLVVAGAALTVTADLQARAVEIAQLRAVGLRRREVRRGLVAQHAVVTGLLVLAGLAVGAAGVWLLAPSLVRSDTGAVAVPAVVPRWPWDMELLLAAGYLLGCLAVAAVAVTRGSRRAEAAHLRWGAS